MLRVAREPELVISIHPPRVGWDALHGGSDVVSPISIHPPRVGWDPLHQKGWRCSRNFNPPTPCGVGHHRIAQARADVHISIHPPRVGWDHGSGPWRLLHPHFNPPTPCGVGPYKVSADWLLGLFQSTHPVWGGTVFHDFFGGDVNISIHPPRVGWDPNRVLRLWLLHSISIHPPRVGWDYRVSLLFLHRFYFNPPTRCGVGRLGQFYYGGVKYFNPPTPCGVGLDPNIQELPDTLFQSTHPVWGGTISGGSLLLPDIFQSTHPVWGGTGHPVQMFL